MCIFSSASYFIYFWVPSIFAGVATRYAFTTFTASWLLPMCYSKRWATYFFVGGALNEQNNQRTFSAQTSSDHPGVLEPSATHHRPAYFRWKWSSRAPLGDQEWNRRVSRGRDGNVLEARYLGLAISVMIVLKQKNKNKHDGVLPHGIVHLFTWLEWGSRFADSRAMVTAYVCLHSRAMVTCVLLWVVLVTACTKPWIGAKAAAICAFGSSWRQPSFCSTTCKCVVCWKYIP